MSKNTTADRVELRYTTIAEGVTVRKQPVPPPALERDRYFQDHDAWLFFATERPPPVGTLLALHGVRVGGGRGKTKKRSKARAFEVRRVSEGADGTPRGCYGVWVADARLAQRDALNTDHLMPLPPRDPNEPLETPPFPVVDRTQTARRARHWRREEPAREDIPVVAIASEYQEPIPRAQGGGKLRKGRLRA